MKKYLIKLCLFAALAVMLAGFCAAGAVFTDSNLITYKTPVGVMHGAGILSGRTDGTFNPTGGITREEAVKIIAYAVLGEQGIMNLPREAPVFSDMSEDRWSAPYVCWAVKNGIIAGVGDGKFDPEGKVTGYQLAKMMLCAAGYGQNGEYSGSSWESTCAKDGFAVGIFANITDADPSRAVTREEAALYIFNGITRLEQVAFDAAAEKYVPTDGTAALDNTIAALVYGIVEVEGRETVFRGVVTENLATGGGATVVNGTAYEYESAAELLGHRVAVYTNGEPGLRKKIYYIADESETVTLGSSINSQQQFNQAFGAELLISDALTIYTADARISEAAEIDGLVPSSYLAPAGSYVFYDGSLISFMPPIPRKAALFDGFVGETLSIGGVEYDRAAVVGDIDCNPGDIVIIQTLSDRLFIERAKSYTGTLRRIEPYLDSNVYFIDNMVFAPSGAENETGLPELTTALNQSYTVFYDKEFRYISIVGAQI